MVLAPSRVPDGEAVTVASVRAPAAVRNLRPTQPAQAAQSREVRGPCSSAGQLGIASDANSLRRPFERALRNAIEDGNDGRRRLGCVPEVGMEHRPGKHVAQQYCVRT